jgi:hypothetical protein
MQEKVYLEKASKSSTNSADPNPTPKSGDRGNPYPNCNLNLT